MNDTLRRLQEGKRAESNEGGVGGISATGRPEYVRDASPQMTTAIVLLVSVSLFGCALKRHPVGPNYVKPTTDLTPFHNLSAVKEVKTELPSPTLDTWWTGFDDPMLVTVVQRALDQNLDLAAAFERVSQARAAAAQAGAQLLPAADLGATITAQRQSAASYFGSIAGGFPGYFRNLHEYHWSGGELGD